MSDFTTNLLSTREELLIHRCRRVARWAACVAGLAGVGMTTFWLARPDWLDRLAVLWLMKGHTALCLAVCSAALILAIDHRAPRLSRGLAVAAGAVGIATLVDYVAGVDLRLTWLGSASGVEVGKMAPQTAAAFVLFAAGILTVHQSTGAGSVVSDGAIVAIGMLLHVVMAGYFYHELTLIGASTYARMTPQTLVALSLLWGALVLSRSDRGLFRILSGEGRGSQVIRYFMPPVLIVPIVMACLRLWFEAEGVEPGQLTLAFAAVQSMLRIGVVLGLGYLLNRSEMARRQEQARREEAERMVAMCAWTRQVRWHGDWVPVERFLHERFGLMVTHGISDEAMTEQLLTLDPRNAAAIVVADEPIARSDAA